MDYSWKVYANIYANIIGKLYAKCHVYGHVLFSRDRVHSFHQMLRRVLSPALGDIQVSHLALTPSPQIPSSFSRLPSATAP